MKRILVLAMALLLVASFSAMSAFAAEAFELIPSDAEWLRTDNGGSSVAVEEIDGAMVFSGSSVDTWPCTTAMYTAAPVVASLDSYTLVYDFTVDGGATNISFFFETASGDNVDYTVCNSMFADRNYDTGSGDLYSGEYKGNIKLSDLVETTRLYNGEAFPVDAIVDGTLRFVGVQVYSVNGGVITVRAMDLVHNDDVVEESPVESLPEEESSVAESSVTEEFMESAPITNEEPTVSVQAESTDATSTPAEKDESVDSTSVLVTVIVVVMVLVCILIAAVLLKKKHHKQ